MKSFYLCCFASLALTMLLAGCGKSGPALTTVKGKVLLDDQPLTEAAVMFSGPEGAVPITAMTDAQGQFTLQAPLGVSQVTVAKSAGGNSAPVNDPNAALMPASGAAPAAPKSLVPEKYSNPKKSDLKVDVQKGMTDVTLNLSSK